ncbi:MAG: VanW family protein [Candidatus Moranbacteria bacterium]|nr:VanW family protein [Candidatus Moranbacteria bacterium]
MALIMGSSVFPTADALTIDAGSFHEDVPTEISAGWFSIGTELIPVSSIRSEIENTSFCDTPVLCTWNLSRRSRETAAVRTTSETNPDAIRSYAVALSSKAVHEPKNAKFGIAEDGSIIAVEKSEDGIAIDEQTIVAAIEKSIRAGSGTVFIPVQTRKPEISSDDLESLGIRELVAEGKTNFAGSPKNRIHNIRRALEQFEGLIIRPEEEFSFVKYLGEVDGAHGYLPELVIKYNKTEPEFGGGICQVSSTIFRAAVNAGLKITARKNHAYPVRYYKPYGMDATIYIPNPDLRFTNNTGNAILILSSIENSTLTFRFYGTKDGRQVEIDGPHILESNPDGSMKTTFSQKVVDASGNTVIDDAFPSSYKSPDLYPHFEILSEKPKGWTKKQWSEYLIQKADYEAKLRAAYATVVRTTDN